MNVVFFSPNFPHQFYLFCTALKAQGATVLGIGDSPPHELRSELRDALTEYVYLPHLDRYDELVRTMGYFTWRYGKIDRIDSHNEHWLALEAQLREDFNIFGQRPAEAGRHRSKAGMGEVFARANVPYPELMTVKNAGSLRDFARKVKLPLVLKPEVGVGAGETFRVNTDDALEAAIARGLNNYVAQKFVQGTITSYDGLVDRNGNIVFATSHIYNSGVMEVVTEQLDLFYWSRRAIPAQLEEYGRRTVEAFGVRERFFHIEFFELADGSYVALEINLRPPGGFTLDMMNWSCDIDLYGLWARMLTGQDLSGFTYHKLYHVAHASRRRQYRYKLSHDELVHRLGPALMMHRTLPPAIGVAMGDDAYLLRHADQDELMKLIGMVQERA